MGKRYSKKPGKVIRGSFAQLMAPGLRDSFMKNFKFPPFSKSVKIYPGAVVPVETSNAVYWFRNDGVYHLVSDKPLPPGIPLDEDIFDSILQHLVWIRDAKKYAVSVASRTYYRKLVFDLENRIDHHYMEALWRQIQKTRSSKI